MLEQNGDGYKLGKTKRRDWHEKDFVFMAHKIWEIEVNAALKKAEINERVDCRTLAQQGIKKIPTIHEGKSRHFKNKKGERTMINEQIEAQNNTLATLLTAPTEEKTEKEILDISRFYTEKVSFGKIENADEENQKDIKLYQYRLAEEKYKGFQIFGLTYINMKNPSYVTMNFADRSTIIDKGSLLTANGGTCTANATRIVNLAQLKGWKSIKLSGSTEFVKEAMLQAHLSGLEINAEGKEQEAILKAIKAEYQKETAKNAVSNVLQAVQTINPNEHAFQKHNSDKPRYTEEEEKKADEARHFIKHLFSTEEPKPKNQNLDSGKTSAEKPKAQTAPASSAVPKIRNIIPSLTSLFIKTPPATPAKPTPAPQSAPRKKGIGL